MVRIECVVTVDMGAIAIGGDVQRGAAGDVRRAWGGGLCPAGGRGAGDLWRGVAAVTTPAAVQYQKSPTI